MEDIPSAVYTIIIASIVSVALAVVGWWISRRSGLGNIQIAVRTETDKLVTAQKERIALLEDKLQELTDRVAHLEEERAKDKREIQRLRKVIADKAIQDAE